MAFRHFSLFRHYCHYIDAFIAISLLPRHDYYAAAIFAIDTPFSLLIMPPRFSFHISPPPPLIAFTLTLRHAHFRRHFTPLLLLFLIRHAIAYAISPRHAIAIRHYYAICAFITLLRHFSPLLPFTLIYYSPVYFRHCCLLFAFH